MAVEYLSEGAVSAGCPVASGVDLVGATLTATATHTTVTGQGSAEVDRAVRQVLDLPDPTVRPPLFGFGVFSGDALAPSNNFHVIGGGVHTNGPFICRNDNFVDGAVTAVGNASVTNNCRIGSMWTGGNFECTASGLIQGDITAAGTGSMTNTCRGLGHGVFGGGFTGSGWNAGSPWSLTGNLISATGSISLQASARIGGLAQAAGSITTNSGAPILTSVPAGVIPNVSSPVPGTPPTVEMPAVTWTDLTVYPGAPTPIAINTWGKQNATANGKPSNNPGCTLAGPSWSVNGPLRSPATPSIIDARTCDLTFQDIDLYLHEDLTIVAKKFTLGGLRVHSAMGAGDPPKLRIVVPLAAGASSCSGTSAGSISSWGTNVVDPGIEVLMYTNGEVQLTNNVTFSGSVYACKTNFSESVKITYADMTPPDMDPPPSEFYEFEPDSRYDLVGLP